MCIGTIFSTAASGTQGDNRLLLCGIAIQSAMVSLDDTSLLFGGNQLTVNMRGYDASEGLTVLSGLYRVICLLVAAGAGRPEGAGEG